MMKLNLTGLIFLLFTFSVLGQITPQFNPIPESYDVNTQNPVFATDINYDSIDLEKQVFHLFLPDTVGQFPLVAFTHGGGYIEGTPDIVLSAVDRKQDIKYFLENGIAYASIGYRLINNTGTDSVGVMKCLNDAKRALQYIRYHSNDLHIDPAKIGLQGRSAGASSSYWLGTRSDMANLNSPNPILQQSTRVCALDLYNPQATLDLNKWETQVFNNFDGNGTNYTLDSMVNLMGFDRASNFYGGFDSLPQILVDPVLVQYREDVDQFTHLSQDDPPIFISSQSSAVHPSEDLFHHALHGREIHNAALAVGIDEIKADIPAFSVNTTNGETGNEFLLRHINSCSLTNSIKDKEISENHISIFPNPIANQFTVAGSLKQCQIVILDANGQIQKTFNKIKNNESVAISDLPNGMYIIKIKDLSTNELNVKKIIKL